MISILARSWFLSWSALDLDSNRDINTGSALDSIMKLCRQSHPPVGNFLRMCLVSMKQLETRGIINDLEFGHRERRGICSTLSYLSYCTTIPSFTVDGLRGRIRDSPDSTNDDQSKFVGDGRSGASAMKCRKLW
ncbi:hypothetical protein EVAR_11683_1 [Eumeta japonica]|uniref:Uncharacterized protein n=1 Tax=Eumeta variegata TaxID=151549 RepID=A0A4C1U4U8_EUMVA|nr:hypothetical protein EVAR_11683_1 [Eumeta japonica]